MRGKRALRRPGEPAQTTTYKHAVTKLILRIEIAESGTSHGWLGYRVDSEAPQTRRKSTQATRRACPNYDLQTCGDQVVVPIEITKSGTSHGWIGYRQHSRAPRAWQKSSQAIRRACPKYDLQTCGDQGVVPIEITKSGTSTDRLNI